MAQANLCPNCGAELPASSPEGLCPRCLMLNALGEPTAAPTELSTDGNGATGEWTPDPADVTRTAQGLQVARKLPDKTTIRYFGDYELQDVLGRGGMGVVYKALQVSLNRPVALKMIKAGVLADDAELKRFQNEAEAVALLDHAGVVPVYEVGEHEGQRYFSMKLVEGGNLAQQLASFTNNPRAAATLLSETAEAVHHAHMRGILHRDLKPANILIDAEGHPHVTDFGLARRVEGHIEMTQSGAVLGTPAYMSPEQASGKRASITTATDVYGLGAILYALLTGKAPFGGDSVIDTLDAVRNRQPDPPKKFNANVPRDLETICLKCLDKDPRKRYASAQELSNDLHNWLDSRPITARRVGPAERAWLWCKRKPAVAGLAAAVLLAAVGGTTAVIAVQAKANKALQASNTLLKKQRVRAEANETQAIDAVKKFQDAVANEPTLKNSPALEDLRKRLLKEPIVFFRSLRDRLQADQDAGLDSLTRLASANFQLAELTFQIGDKPDALRAYQESLPVLERLERANPSDIRFSIELASTHNNIGEIYAMLGKPTEALSSYERARAIFARLAQDNPSDLRVNSDLAGGYSNTGVVQREIGRPVEALQSFSKALSIFESLSQINPSEAPLQLSIATTHGNIAGVHRDMGRNADELRELELARAVLDRLTRDRPAEAEFASLLAKNQSSIGAVQRDMGRNAESLSSFEQARTILEQLTQKNMSVTGYQSALAESYFHIASLLSESGKAAESLEWHQKALPIRETLARDHPSVTQFQYDLAESLLQIGTLNSNLGRHDKALVSSERARGILELLVRENPSYVQYQSQLASSLNNIGITLLNLGRREEALASYQDSIVIRERLAREHPESPDLASSLGGNLNNIAMINLDQKQFEEARTKLLRAIEWQHKALSVKPNHPTYRLFLSNHLGNLIKVAEALGRPDEAENARLELKELTRTDPRFATLDARLAEVLKGDVPKTNVERLTLAQRAYDTSRYAAAARLWTEAVEADPKLGEQRQAQHRYNAACSAALAAAGKAKDEPAPDAASVASLRSRALALLKAEVAAWSSFIDNVPPQARPVIAQVLEHWKEDTDLKSIRDEKDLATLPESERNDWISLWSDVEALLKRARELKP